MEIRIKVIEKSKMAEEEKKHGKKGVMAKVADIDKKCREIEAGAKEQIANIKAQARENADAVAEMDAGTRELIGSIDAKCREVDAAAKQQIANMKAQAKENDAYVEDFYYG